MEGNVPRRFLDLEEDYIECKRTINNSIHDLSQHDLRQSGSQLAHANIIEAQRCIKLMSIELRGKSPGIRKELQGKINVYREELNGLQRDIDRALLISNEKPKSNSSSYERIAINTDRLHRVSEKLEESKRIVKETEEIGITVMDTLAQQRETLLSSHDKIKETREIAGDARRILQRMTRRIFTDKLTLWFVILSLVIAIVLVFYHNFIQH